MTTIFSPKPKPPRPHSRQSIAHVPPVGPTGKHENVTVDLSGLSSASRLIPTAKKPRSRSIGPGGLDALQESSGNRGVNPLAPSVKSILKPTISLSPPKKIPPHSALRKPPPSPTKSLYQASPKIKKIGVNEGLLIDTSETTSSTPQTGPSLPNLFGDLHPSQEVGAVPRSPSRSQSRVVIRTEEEQQAAARERERQEKESASRKDARRKSLANRRVSFAPEATLHTWDVVELPEDSTTSSASGNSTRRASGLSAVAASPLPQPRSRLPDWDTPRPPSTPLEEEDEPRLAMSPAHQRDLHQEKRRRSSGIPSMDFNNPEDFSSSPHSESSDNSDDTGSQPCMAADEIDSSDSEDKDLVEDESTLMAIDNDDMTAQSIMSARSGSSTGSSGRLEKALRQAAEQARTQGIEYDEHRDITMEIANDEITRPFQSWHNSRSKAQTIDTSSVFRDQEDVNPFSPAFRSGVKAQNNENTGITMDFTRAAGSILPVPVGNIVSSNLTDQNSKAKSIRKSFGGDGRRSSEASSMFGDETMELTNAIGAIENDQRVSFQFNDVPERDASKDEDDEELTMELTSVTGGVLEKGTVQRHSGRQENSRRSIASSITEEDMDMTSADGGILSSITERTEPSKDHTLDMDITQAVGVILPQQLGVDGQIKAKASMERQLDVEQLPPVDPFYEGPRNSLSGSHHDAVQGDKLLDTDTSELGNAGSSSKRKNSRRSLGSKNSVLPKESSRHSTPIKGAAKVTTPSKQLTPLIGPRPTTPGKTPPSKNITLRAASPKRLFAAKVVDPVSSPIATTNDVFPQPYVSGGVQTPVVLKSCHRRLSGLGADQEGLGSPLVTELLDRRGSISQSARPFVSSHHSNVPNSVHFEDPRAIEREIEQERVEDEHKESGRGILQREADSQISEEEKDATVNLKDKIQSLTPQKKKVKYRKSLHVGAAKGLLGKRPAELDDEEDEDGEDAVSKRLKDREGSPIKKIKLPATQLKTEMTGRALRSARPTLSETTGNARITTPMMETSPLKGSRATTPKNQRRFKNMDAHETDDQPVAPFNQKMESERPIVTEPPEEEDRIHLQEFLNMTNIRFMELTTTKRRLKTAANIPESAKKKGPLGLASKEESGADAELESYVVAGACTVPMLELYEHSCRELKKHIAEGRDVVREIEANTFEENPALFREYMIAPPNIKSIMDNQFKNVKTHARLLSKAMWYEWRMKLLEGLKEGLSKDEEGMSEDDKCLGQQEEIIESILPAMIEKNDALVAESQTLQAHADMLASCDQEEYKEARRRLSQVEQEVKSKQQMVLELERQLKANAEEMANAVDCKEEYVAQTKEAERVRQESRGWKTSEVAVLQDNVLALEEAYGWRIVSATGQSLTMTYKDSLQLYFTPVSFISPGSSSSAQSDESPISLTYIGDAHEHHSRPLTTEKRFFLQIVRAQLQCLQQSSTDTSDLLSFIGRNWEAALTVAEEIRSLGIGYITEATILSDEVLAVQAVLLMREMRTKVEVSFQVQAQGGEGVTGLDIAVKSGARVVYGEGLKEKKMADFLDQKLSEGGAGAEAGTWVKAVRKLEERLRQRGKR